MTRRVKRTLKRIDPLSVLKLSFFYYLVFLALWLIMVAIVYSLLSSFGFFDFLHGVGQGAVLKSLSHLEISLGTVEKWAFLVGFVLVLIASIVNAFLAFLYNIGADVTGGIEMTYVERE